MNVGILVVDDGLPPICFGSVSVVDRRTAEWSSDCFTRSHEKSSGPDEGRLWGMKSGSRQYG
jgi:hypothetical protein